MSTRTLLALTLATALLATACAKKEEPKAEAPTEPAAPAVDLAAEEQAIRTRSGEWMNYANSKDAASMATKMYAPDGILISEDKAYKGAAAIQAKYEADIKKSPDAVISWTSDQVRVSSDGNMAVEYGNFSMDPDGEGKGRPSRARSRRPGPRSTANGACCQMPAARTRRHRRPEAAAPAA